MTEKNVTIDAPEVPQSHIDFAKDIAEAARKHGIERFETTYTVGFTGIFKLPSMLHGEMLIRYNSKDGRGRPLTDLKLTLNAKMAVNLGGKQL